MIPFIPFLGADQPQYSAAQLEADIAATKPRLFDTYILPAFMVWYAVKDRGMGRLARRMLFVAGVYMGYRSYGEYKKLAQSVMNQTQEPAA